ncbi:MAG TPA: hypothetical protein PLH57_01450 [Oligoflexia bacterium]|nr:hypothetical protein [Oligoflexia bacterium]
MNQSLRKKTVGLFLVLINLLCMHSSAQQKDKTILGMISQRNAQSDQQANLTQGFFEVGGSLGFHNTFKNGDDYSHLILSFVSEYFVIDRLSLGGQFSHYSTRGFNETAIGPSGKYYFFQKDSFAPFGGLAVLYNNSNDFRYYFSTKATFGFKYFVTPAVGIVSSLSWFHLFGGNRFDSRATLNRVSLEMGLSVHL